MATLQGPTPHSLSSNSTSRLQVWWAKVKDSDPYICQSNGALVPLQYSNSIFKFEVKTWTCSIGLENSVSSKLGTKLAKTKVNTLLTHSYWAHSTSRSLTYLTLAHQSWKLWAWSQVVGQWQPRSAWRLETLGPNSKVIRWQVRSPILVFEHAPHCREFWTFNN